MQTIRDVIASLFLQTDLYHLAILFVVVASACWLMRDLRAIITATVLSIAVFAAASYALELVSAGGNAATYARGEFNRFLGLNIVSLTTYALFFAALIMVFHNVRGALGCR